MRFEVAKRYLAEFEDNFGDILSLKDDEIIDFSFKTKSYISVDDQICLPIITSNSFNKSRNPDLFFPNYQNFGRILFLKNKEYPLGALTREQLLCYITEKPDLTIQDSHKFEKDFLVLKRRSLNTYFVKYKKSSIIWGDYMHIDDVPEISFSETYRSGKVHAHQDINTDYSLYQENLYLSLIEKNPFQRFLKLYHLLEMQFDLHTAEQIKNYLSQKKYREISSKLSQYGREELNRLESIIKDYCKDTEAIATLMNNVDVDTETAEDLFYYPGRIVKLVKKDFKKILLRPDKFLDKDFISGSGSGPGLPYNNIINKTCAYWIYRVRSSIAHNRFGEYILSSSKEAFIVKFAEPLLKEVVKQCFIK